MTRRQALSILTADIASGLVGFLAPISAWKYLIIFGKIGSSLETYDGVFLKSQKFLNVFFLTKVSTALIVVFGEILPQAACSRYALQAWNQT